MNRLGKLFVAAAIAVVPAACKKDEVQKTADRAAKNLEDKQRALADETKDVHKSVEDTRRTATDYVTSDTEMETTRKMHGDRLENTAQQIGEQSQDVQAKAEDVRVASYEFEMRRRERVNELRGVHGVIASQVPLITTLASATPLTDKARNELGNRMQAFTAKLNDSSNAIEALQVTNAQDFKSRDADAQKALESVNDARRKAWDALNDGDRVEPS